MKSAKEILESQTFLTDFEVMIGKVRSQKIMYELLCEKFAEGMQTIVFSTRNVFDEEAYMIQMKILFELADNFNIQAVNDVYKCLFKRKISSEYVIQFCTARI